LNDLESPSILGGNANITLCLSRNTGREPYGALRQRMGSVLRELAGQRESRIEQGHLMLDHVHMLISIPPKYSVAEVVAYINGKSAIYIARTFMGKRRNLTVSGRGDTSSQR